jgi:hypothetical protein
VAPLGQAPLSDSAKTANTLTCTAILHSCYVAHKCVEAAEWTSEILRLPQLAAREGPTPLVISLVSIRGRHDRLHRQQDLRRFRAVG